MDILAFLLAILAGEMTEEEITTAVAAWLNDHPEATTTVEDGAITLSKMNASTYGTLNEFKAYIGIA